MREQLAVFLAKERAKGTPVNQVMDDLRANGFSQPEVESARDSMQSLPAPAPRRRLLPVFVLWVALLLLLVAALR